MKLIKAIDIDKNNDLYKYSNPKNAQKNAYKLFGKSGILYKSTKSNKKYMIYDIFKNKYIHFNSNLFHFIIKPRTRTFHLRFKSSSLFKSSFAVEQLL